MFQQYPKVSCVNIKGATRDASSTSDPHAPHHSKRHRVVTLPSSQKCSVPGQVFRSMHSGTYKLVFLCTGKLQRSNNRQSSLFLLVTAHKDFNSRVPMQSSSSNPQLSFGIANLEMLSCSRWSRRRP